MPFPGFRIRNRASWSVDYESPGQHAAFSTVSSVMAYRMANSFVLQLFIMAIYFKKECIYDLTVRIEI